jgi:hypothetical protein
LGLVDDDVRERAGELIDIDCRQRPSSTSASRIPSWRSLGHHAVVVRLQQLVDDEIHGGPLGRVGPRWRRRRSGSPGSPSRSRAASSNGRSLTVHAHGSSRCSSATSSGVSQGAQARR